MEVSSGKPYTEFSLMTDDKLRLFSENVNPDELVWHRDVNPRRVYVQRGKGWKLQMDNELPKELKIGHVYEIPEMTYHRLIKGTGSLLVRIKEL